MIEKARARAGIGATIERRACLSAFDYSDSAG